MMHSINSKTSIKKNKKKKAERIKKKSTPKIIFSTRELKMLGWK